LHVLLAESDGVACRFPLAGGEVVPAMRMLLGLTCNVAGSGRILPVEANEAGVATVERLGLFIGHFALEGDESIDNGVTGGVHGGTRSRSRGRLGTSDTTGFASGLTIRGVPTSSGRGEVAKQCDRMNRNARLEGPVLSKVLGIMGCRKQEVIGGLGQLLRGALKEPKVRSGQLLLPTNSLEQRAEGLSVGSPV
jgi:hypothetical protein